MKTKFGAIIVDGRGKIGGHVASKNRAGSYLRTKVTPVNPQTTAQLDARSLFTQIAQSWRGLSASAVSSWNSAVSAYQRTDVFGDLKTPSGFNLFQRLNNNLISVNSSGLILPPLPVAVPACSATSLTFVESADDVSLILSNAVPGNCAVKVFATPPISSGVSFVKSEYRQITVLPAATGSPVNIASSYIAKFGATGVAGQKVFVKVVAISTECGLAGSASEVSAVISAD